MRDRLIAAVRTAVQSFIALVVASLVAWLGSFGIEIVIGPEIIETLSSVVTLIVGAVIIGVWTFVQNWAEDRWPTLARILSFNLSASTPEYEETR